MPTADDVAATVTHILETPTLLVSEAVDRLVQLRNGHLHSVGHTPSVVAAYGNQYQDGTYNVIDFIKDLWRGFAETAERSDAVQPRIIEILGLLMTTPGGPYRFYDSDEVLWEDITVDQLQSWEGRDKFFAEPITTQMPLHPQDRTRWINFNRFYARLWEEGIMDCGIYGLHALRLGVENEDVREDQSLRIEAAASWVLLAARMMFLSREIYGPRGNPDWPSNQGIRGRGGRLWNGVDGYAPARWTFWKSRFEAICADARQQSSAADAAKAAITRMTEVEALLAHTLPIAEPVTLTRRTVDLLDDLWTEVFEFYFAPDDELRSGPHMASEALFLSRTCKRWLRLIEPFMYRHLEFPDLERAWCTLAGNNKADKLLRWTRTIILQGSTYNGPGGHHNTPISFLHAAETLLSNVSVLTTLRLDYIGAPKGILAAVSLAVASSLRDLDVSTVKEDLPLCLESVGAFVNLRVLALSLSPLCLSDSTTPSTPWTLQWLEDMEIQLEPADDPGLESHAHVLGLLAKCNLPRLALFRIEAVNLKNDEEKGLLGFFSRQTSLEHCELETGYGTCDGRWIASALSETSAGSVTFFGHIPRLCAISPGIRHLKITTGLRQPEQDALHSFLDTLETQLQQRQGITLATISFDSLLSWSEGAASYGENFMEKLRGHAARLHKQGVRLLDYYGSTADGV